MQENSARFPVKGCNFNQIHERQILNFISVSGMTISCSDKETTLCQRRRINNEREICRKREDRSLWCIWSEDGWMLKDSTSYLIDYILRKEVRKSKNTPRYTDLIIRSFIFPILWAVVQRILFDTVAVDSGGEILSAIGHFAWWSSILGGQTTIVESRGIDTMGASCHIKHAWERDTGRFHAQLCFTHTVTYSKASTIITGFNRH